MKKERERERLWRTACIFLAVGVCTGAAGAGVGVGVPAGVAAELVLLSFLVWMDLHKGEGEEKNAWGGTDSRPS